MDACLQPLPFSRNAPLVVDLESIPDQPPVAAGQLHLFEDAPIPCCIDQDQDGIVDDISQQALIIGLDPPIVTAWRGEADPENNLLKRAPHPLHVVAADAWDRPYGRERAGFPTPATRVHKVWPTVARIDAAYGDRNLICACPPIEMYAGR